jgi:hypothetical protein
LSGARFTNSKEPSMLGAVLGVILGYAVWTGLWLSGNAVFFAEANKQVGDGDAYNEVLPLAGLIGLSIVCSLVAGLTTAMVARTRRKTAVFTTALLLLATGVFVQAGVWALMPVWYHITFLTLIAPVVIFGASFIKPAK